MRNINNSVLLKNWLEDTSFYADSVVADEEFLQKEGEKKALQLFHDAAKNVPAYKEFLQTHRITANKIKTIQEFKEIPATTKENYIDKYDMKLRCWGGVLDTMHIISTSSGTTGIPHFWPRDLQTEIEGAYAHEFILKNIFQIDKKKTLFINGFAMGTWIAGTFTLSATTFLAWKGYSLTTMTPGYSLEAVVELIEMLHRNFDQIVLTGHIPFLKEVIELTKKKNIPLDNIVLLGTGQGITENWRKYMLQLLSSEKHPNNIINLYGSADAALMGFETPISITIRKKLDALPKIAKNIFHDERLPSLYNYDPRLIYFEALNKELLITKNGGCPLIRYNIHDQGGTFTHTNLLTQVYKKNSIDFMENKYPKLPFVYLFGREKFMVKIYGANVYSEHVQQALNHPKLQPYITGRFLLETDYDENQNPQMICRIELNTEIKESPEIVKQIEETFVQEVKSINSEYNFVLEHIGKHVRPKIYVYENGHQIYFPKNKIKKTA